MKGVHRDMRGNVIGGYTADGRGYGNKAPWTERIQRPAAPAPAAAPTTAAPAPAPNPAVPPKTNTPVPPKPAAPAPVGKIDGMPAKQSLAGYRKGAEAAWQGKVKPPTFGKEIATANIASKGVLGAIADYQARSQKEAGQKFAAAAPPIATNPVAASTGTKPSWQQAIAPQGKKGGGLESTIDSVRQARVDTQKLIPQRKKDSVVAN